MENVRHRITTSIQLSISRDGAFSSFPPYHYPGARPQSPLTHISSFFLQINYLGLIFTYIQCVELSSFCSIFSIHRHAWRSTLLHRFSRQIFLLFFLYGNPMGTRPNLNHLRKNKPGDVWCLLYPNARGYGMIDHYSNYA